MSVFKLAPLSALIAFLALGSATPVGPPQDPSPIKPPDGKDSGSSPPFGAFGEMTVIGDSYAAGGGANGWIQPLVGCMQSDSAYGHWLKDESDLGIKQINMQACAGSGAGEVQVCQLGEDPNSYKGPKPNCSNINPKGAGNPGLIVSQFGVDKIAFDQVLRACLYRRAEFSCDDALKASNQHLDDLEKSTDIEDTLTKAMEKTALNEWGQVLALNFPAPFNVDTKDCYFGIYESNSTEDWSGQKEKHPQLRRDINMLVQRLNGIILKQADAANGTQTPMGKTPFKEAPTGVNRLRIVDVDGAFMGHRWCDLQEEWFTALYTWQQTAIYLNADEPQFYGGLFHPNFDGQRAISNAIRQTLGIKPLDAATTDKFIKHQQNKDPMEAEPWQQDDKDDKPAEPIQKASIPDIAQPPPPPKMDPAELEHILEEIQNDTDFGGYGDMGLGEDFGQDYGDGGGDDLIDDAGDEDLGDDTEDVDDSSDDKNNSPPPKADPPKPDTPKPDPPKPDPPKPDPPKPDPPKPDPPAPDPAKGPCDDLKGTPKWEPCIDSH